MDKIKQFGSHPRPAGTLQLNLDCILSGILLHVHFNLARCRDLSLQGQSHPEQGEGEGGLGGCITFHQAEVVMFSH